MHTLGKVLGKHLKSHFTNFLEFQVVLLLVKRMLKADYRGTE